MPKASRKEVTIEVTEEDFDRATPRNSGHCAISDAITRKMPWVNQITTDLQSIRWSDPRVGLRYVFFTPRVAQLALIDFDDGNAAALEPFTMRLRNPHIGPTRQKAGPAAVAQAEALKARREAAQAKLDAGEKLTRSERATLTNAKSRPRKAQATSPGPRTVKVYNSGRKGKLSPNEDVPKGGERVEIDGGTLPAIAALAHGMGHRREFGLRAAGKSGRMPPASGAKNETPGRRRLYRNGGGKKAS